MQKQNLIIGASTNYDWNKLKYWINSIKMSGFRGDIALILMNCDKDTVKKVSDAGVQIIGFVQDNEGNLKHQSGMPIHTERFLHIHNFLSDKLYRYVITTDVKDVIFQRNPIEYLEKNLGEDQNLMFASESIRYKDEAWGNQNLMETYANYIYDHFKDNVIYNVGVLGGRGFAMRDLAINIFAASMGRPIPICDQSTFNFLVSMSPYLETSVYSKSEDGWAAQLGTTADPSKVDEFRPFLLEPSPIMKDGEVTTSTGLPFTIVHQYDRVPEWRKIIEAKYG
jgi:hypothetical protein